MVAASFSRTHSPSRLAWSGGWRPPGDQSTFIRWDDSTINIVTVNVIIIIQKQKHSNSKHLVFEWVAFTLCAVEAAKTHLQFVVEDQQLFNSWPHVTARPDQWKWRGRTGIIQWRRAGTLVLPHTSIWDRQRRTESRLQKLRLLGPTLNVKVAHTRLPSVGFRSWSRCLAVSLQVRWVINRAVGCHYFLPGLQLPPQPLRGLLPILLLGEQRHNGCEQFA